MSDIYDSAFRTLLNDCSKLILPLINEMFGEHYTGNERIDFYPNEHFISQQTDGELKRITDTNFAVDNGKVRKKYHWECQSTPDSRMLIRLFEYDAQIALDDGVCGVESLTVEFPNSAVLYLRSAKKTPDNYRYIIKTPGGTVSYSVPVMKVKAYSLDDIFSKKLLLLIPFFIFTFEADFPKYEADAEKLNALKAEYQTILQKLEQMEQNDEIGEFDRLTILELSDEVVKSLASKYQNVLKGVEDTMMGPIIETRVKKMWTEGRKEGMLSFALDMVKSGLLSIKDAAARLGMSEDAFKEQFAAFSAQS